MGPGSPGSAPSAGLARAGPGTGDVGRVDPDRLRVLERSARRELPRGPTEGAGGLDDRRAGLYQAVLSTEPAQPGIHAAQPDRGNGLRGRRHGAHPHESDVDPQQRVPGRLRASVPGPAPVHGARGRVAHPYRDGCGDRGTRHGNSGPRAPRDQVQRPAGLLRNHRTVGRGILPAVLGCGDVAGRAGFLYVGVRTGRRDAPDDARRGPSRLPVRTEGPGPLDGTLSRRRCESDARFPMARIRIGW